MANAGRDAASRDCLAKSGLYNPNTRTGDTVSHCFLRACTQLFLVALALVLGHTLQVVRWGGTEQVSSGSNSQRGLASSVQIPGQVPSPFSASEVYL